MNKDLSALIQLQEVDTKIYDLAQSKKEFPVEVEKQTAQVAQAEAAAASISKKIEDLATEHKNVEDQIVQAKLALNRSEGRLNSITTNREYDAVHSEIESQKHLIANGESRLKTLAEETTRLAASQEEAKKEAERIRAENQPKIDELNQKIASIDSDIAAATVERDKLAAAVNRQFLRTYDHIHDRRKNSKVLSMIGGGSRTCAICHKILEPQLISEIRKGSRLHICESCGSILVWQFPAEESAAQGDAAGAAPSV